MKDQYTYLALMIGTILVPFIMSFEKKVHFISKIKPFLMSNVLMFIFFVVWDAIFTERGVWSFNPEYHLDLKLFGLPLEELLFFIFVPYACIFIYENVKHFINDISYKIGYYFSISVLSLMIMLLVVFDGGIYTQTTFLLLGILLFLNMKKAWITQFHIAYLICLIPFGIVNGILTYLPVVVYNDSENLSIRLVSIPFEDIFYGMAMILLNIMFYENILKKKDV